MLLIIHSSSLYKEMQRFYVFQLSNQFCNFRLQNCLMLPADKISSGNNVFPINCWGKPLNSKGLVQHLPRLYSGWGFLTSQCDRQLKFSAHCFIKDFVKPLKIWAHLDNFFFIVSKGGEKERCWKIAITIN